MPTLLLHSCCGPCSSYVLEYLTKYFDVTVLYFNPNIYPAEEYEHRLGEQRRIISLLPTEHSVKFLEANMTTSNSSKPQRAMSRRREGRSRCEKCFYLRLERTALEAKKHGFDYFTTTLSVSPHKNSQLLNRIGEEMGEKYGVRHLPADFKKREGYKRSIELSKQYGLYRQDYCGCEFSKQG